jgi:hypothetical protein
VIFIGVLDSAGGMLAPVIDPGAHLARGWCPDVQRRVEPTVARAPSSIIQRRIGRRLVAR